MGSVMSLINGTLGTVFDLLLYPFRGMHPMVGLTVVSAIAAVGMLLGYKATSNQPAIERVKRRIAAGLFEIRLFNDDLRAILRAQGWILVNNLEYMRLNLVPMLWMIVPFVLVVAQLQFHYGYEGLDVGRPTLLQVTLHDNAGTDRVELEVPEGVRIDSPRVWVPSLRQAAWRIVPESAGTYDLRVIVDGTVYDKQIVASDLIERRSPERLAPGFLNQLLYPAEPALPSDGTVEEITVDYPDRSVGLFGFEGHWLIAFLILSIALAFMLKSRFDVTI